MAIFQILFPDIWAKIHLELVTPLDARDRVSLQRTCKAAHALDPGLILAPKWREVWNTEEAVTRTQVTTRRMQRYGRRNEQRHAMLLQFLTQLDQQGVFDWCPPVLRISFYWDEGPRCDGIYIYWPLRPDQREREYLETLSIAYEPQNRYFQWILSMFPGDEHLTHLRFFEGISATLEGLWPQASPLIFDESFDFERDDDE
jgi:hypothetical protein